MAKETGAGGAHRAYGFYFGSVAYTVTVDRQPWAECVPGAYRY
jgi:hypothetical protein